MTENLLQSGLQLTLYGMGTVVIFLVLLIFVTRAMSWAALRYDRSLSQVIPDIRDVSSTPNIEQDQLIAVISAAISKYRNSKSE